MIGFLIQLLVVLLVIGVLWYIIASLLPVPQPIKNVALAILLLVFVLWVLGYAGVFPGMRWR